MSDDSAIIAASIDDMYDAFLAGDRQRFDSHLHSDVTTWETHLAGPLRTRSELDAYREQRDAAGIRPVLAALTATEMRVDVWGDTAVARYVLVAEPPSGEAEQSRVTDVLRRTDGGWVIVHHHAELLGGPALQEWNVSEDVTPQTGDMEIYDLRVTVDRIEGRSVCGMAVCDQFELTDSAHLRLPAGKHFCVYALASVLPFLAAKQRDVPPGDWLAQDSLFACPDPEERLVMRVERSRRRRMDSADLT